MIGAFAAPADVEGFAGEGFACDGDAVGACDEVDVERADYRDYGLCTRHCCEWSAVDLQLGVFMVGW